ncbi:MAG: DivIVA domain-containing protein [Coriobacteriales bacterium]|nr:DivIVA domain-containing protein [Coriobacteriales bacterium]
MKLTPLDIHHKEFGHSLRGYNEEQVDQFLDEVADEFERLFKENIDLSEKLEAAQQRLNEFEMQRQTINNTLVAAQRSAEDIQTKAQTEADTMLRDAEVKAKEIIHNALSRKQQVQGELVRIKQAEEDFRARLKQMLDGYQRQIAEIELPSDVEVMLGETEEGIIGDVAVRPQQQLSPQAADEAFASLDFGDIGSEPTAPPLPGPTEEEAPAPRLEMEHDAVAAPVPAQIVEEPPASGFVQSVALGEVGEVDLGPDVPSLDEPDEFQMPSLGRLGERDDDVDIEEID